MNTNEIIGFVNEFSKDAEYIIANEGYGIKEDKQNELTTQLNKINDKLFDNQMIFHCTDIDKLNGIIDENLIRAERYPKSHFLSNYFYIYPLASKMVSGGHYENLFMTQSIIRNISYRNSLDQPDKDIERRLFILNELNKDIAPKVFFSDDIGFTFKLRNREFNFNNSRNNKGLAILCINKENVDCKEKYHYMEDHPRVNTFYWFCDDEEEVNQEFIKKHANFLDVEFVSYDDVPFSFVEYIILIDKYNVRCVLKKDGDTYEILSNQ
jgi:hypothetical protein